MKHGNQILFTRYARALLVLAEENNILTRSYEDMCLVQDAFRLHKELKLLLRNPIVRIFNKQQLIQRVFAARIHPLLLHYMAIIVRKQRGGLLEGIAEAYQRVYKHHIGLETVKITTAVPLDDALRIRAMEVARTLTPLQIDFEEIVDPDLIGGFILNISDIQYDASVKSRLVRIRKHLQID